MLYQNWKNEINEFTVEKTKGRIEIPGGRKEEVNIQKSKLKENVEKIKNIKFHLKEYAE